MATGVTPGPRAQAGPPMQSPGPLRAPRRWSLARASEPGGSRTQERRTGRRGTGETGDRETGDRETGTGRRGTGRRGTGERGTGRRGDRGDEDRGARTGRRGPGDEDRETRTGRRGPGDEDRETRTGRRGPGDEDRETRTGRRGPGDEDRETRTGRRGPGDEDRETGERLAPYPPPQPIRLEKIGKNNCRRVEKILDVRHPSPSEIDNDTDDRRSRGTRVILVRDWNGETSIGQARRLLRRHRQVPPAVCRSWLRRRPCHPAHAQRPAPAVTPRIRPARRASLHCGQWATTDQHPGPRRSQLLLDPFR